MLQDHIEGVRAGFADLPSGRAGEASIEIIDWREAAERLYQTLANAGEEAAVTPSWRVAHLLLALSESFGAENR
jgi:hypothetical protein